MLIKLIDVIRQFLSPERYCPCVICFNERKETIVNQVEEIERRERRGA